MKKMYKITSPEGIHARPAALLVTAVTPFESDIQLTYKGKSVNLKSIMGVMSLGVTPGSIVEISAAGPDIEKLFQTVTEIMVSKEIGEEC
ncbi:MAG TPA: HPr family phosphocarrier protein [Lysinibacillus sp.]|jgi:phosphocarrier protein HPr|uniref:Phosphocarrier protein HPr n=1 Tax=Lysinibacillus fusiformis TaxID=28031 RepID=A0A2I0V1G8_9BACI|nr:MULTISPECIES: HPr family phosphocarrier protein [Lysinibacillus]HBT72985.1 HPr family phosphocarrier protein [Lysinibacillus sp.]KUF34508.1 phosphocarrier protein HPr [Lysinibacillus sp. F5]MEE3805789.1 HPr family phosphocarrier protein [Lysinibacillus fusiformis]PKU52116.1 HPr family phosphocarrier protein [Lysinibacillus fusiformis]WCH46509.1 HPr family phosphocarrier protein [Lysinibacillus sp. OF-1]